MSPFPSPTSYFSSIPGLSSPLYLFSSLIQLKYVAVFKRSPRNLRLSADLCTARRGEKGNLGQCRGFYLFPGTWTPIPCPIGSTLSSIIITESSAHPSSYPRNRKGSLCVYSLICQIYRGTPAQRSIVRFCY